MTYNGGNSGNGVVFEVSVNGTGFNVLHNFDSVGGANPDAELLLAGKTLYGTTTGGGAFGQGALFSLSLPPPGLSLNISDENVTVTWPTNDAEFALQSTTNPIPPIGWDTNLPAPVIVDGQYTVTNPISGTQKFYRLSQ
jgi:uncharacterized repeat protein (TIGR03803 family)